jgi:hypothetical protein
MCMALQATSLRARVRRVDVRRMATGAAQAALLLFIVGADCNNKQVAAPVTAQLVSGVAPTVSVRATGQVGTPAPGGPVTRDVFVQCPKPGGPDSVTLLWYPPAGASALAFPAALPTNPDGPPPYQFPDVAVSDAGDPQAAASVTVAYAAPAPPEPTGATTFVDVFTAIDADGSRISASFEDAEASTGAVSSVTALVAPSARRAEPVYLLWSAEQTVTPDATVPLDQSLCQAWSGFLQGDDFFIALRFPVQAPDSADARSAELPVVFPADAGAAPKLALQSTEPSPAAVFSIPLELRPDRLGFAENNLPQAEGERWVTLAPAAEPLADCPAGLGGGWRLAGDLALDFGGDASSCSECVLQEYLCYRGDAAPFPFTWASQASLQAAYAGAGTTCLGPIPIRLAGDPAAPTFAVEGVGLARTNSSALVKFAHHLRGWLAPDEEASVGLSATSARTIPWALYSDSGLTHPISGPVTISGTAPFDFWAAARLPFGFRGAETVTVTAASADPGGGQTWTSDHLWSGAWTPPPPEPDLHVGAGVVERGGLVTVSGSLPNGSYRLVVVPNGVFLPGDCYTGPVTAETDVVVANGSLPPVIVWVGAELGSWDVLALSGSCGGANSTRIVAGDGLSDAAAVRVVATPHRHLKH